MLRKTYRLRKGKILEVEEYHQGNYGAPGKRRNKKEKPTKEQMQLINRMNKRKNCRLRLLEYFNEGDIFATWTYSIENRPGDMAAALKDFQKAKRKVQREYRKRGKELFWIRNIERGTKGAWHIHLIVNEIGDSASIIQRAWEKGGTYCCDIRHNSKVYDEDFSKLASYMTKTAGIGEKKVDGTTEKARIKESNYGTSKNMPLPEPKKKILFQWKTEIKPVKGYYIVKYYQGINPVNGFPYRRYTMISLNDIPEGGRKRQQYTAKISGKCRRIKRERNKQKKMKQLNGYYYCLSKDKYNHELCSAAKITRKDAIQWALTRKSRLYLVKYRKDEQIGKKRRIRLTAE